MGLVREIAAYGANNIVGVEELFNCEEGRRCYASHPNLGIPFEKKDGKVVQFEMTERGKLALIAFLNTLSDPAMLADPKFSDPFLPRP